jgi:patatin-like phospholipase/acyl hydrolase
MNDCVRILSIDGGGIRGIIPAMLLAEIERRTGRPIASMFDLIAGTSTGGLLSLGLVVGDDSGKPRFNASDMVALYRDEAQTIFPRNFFKQALATFAGPKYPDVGIDGVLQSRFGAARLKDALTDVLITSYDLERGEAILFKSREAKLDSHQDFPMWQVARGTSAAPTYFSPIKVVPEDPNLPYLALIDGGVYANNPALTAYAEAVKHHLEPDTRILVVSLGTGALTHRISYEDAVRWGALEWAVPILNILFDEGSAGVDRVMRRLLDVACDPPAYYRFQGDLDPSDDAMDNASPENIHALQNVAESIIQDQAEALDAVCARLVHDAEEKTKKAPAGG